MNAYTAAVTANACMGRTTQKFPFPVEDLDPHLIRVSLPDDISIY